MGKKPFEPQHLPSQRVLALLRYAKKPGADLGWRGVITALSDVYHPEMLLTHVIHHLAEGFSELLNERRFQVGGNGRSAEELLLSPICGHLSVTWPRPATLDTQCTVDAFYDSISRYILGQFSIAAIGWCRPWYEGKTTDSLSHADGENIAC